MTIEERVYSLLVPSRVVDRLYPLTAPDQTPTPYTTYLYMISGNLTTHSSPLPATRQWHAQYTTFSETYGVARAGGDAIQSALVGYADNSILGVTPLHQRPSWDDISKLYGWILELLITEQLA